MSKMVLALAGLCISTAACREKSAPPRPRTAPNIVLVSIDTLRFDATSLSAQRANDTPALASLAKRGINFTRCYSTTDSTPPSHFSMLTGFVAGILTPIDRTELSLPAVLRARGYRTFGVAANGNLSPRFMRSLMGFQSFVNLVDERLEKHPAPDPDDDRTLQRYHHVLNDWNRETVAVKADVALARFLPQLDGAKPFFGFLNLMDVHDPYVPDARFYDVSAERVPAGELRFRNVPAIPPDRAQTLAVAQGRPWSTSFDLSDGEIATFHDRYRAEVRQLDAALGKLVDALHARGLDDTVLILTSDHGEAFGEEHLMTHSFDNHGPREATHHVPLLVVLPRAYNVANREVRYLCTIADIPATIYQLAGVDPQAVWESTIPGNFGRSLLPLAGVETANADDVARVALPALDENTRNRQDREAQERFRSLGYLQ